MKERLLTMEDAYDAMVDYLEKYYQATESDDIGSLLGGMMLLSDNEPLDSAMWQDWLESTKGNNKLNFEEAYEAMIAFLSGYANRIYSEEIRGLLASMHKKEVNNASLGEWINSVEKILSRSPRIRPYFELQP